MANASEGDDVVCQFQSVIGFQGHRGAHHDLAHEPLFAVVHGCSSCKRFKKQRKTSTYVTMPTIPSAPSTIGMPPTFSLIKSSTASRRSSSGESVNGSLVITSPILVRSVFSRASGADINALLRNARMSRSVLMPYKTRSFLTGV